MRHHDAYVRWALIAWAIALGAWLLFRSRDSVEGFSDGTVKAKSVVTQIFHDVLWRNPSPQELDDYSGRLSGGDPGFDSDALRTVLYTSEEYRRLDKVQNNAARVNLMGDVTDRQLTYLVKASYANVFGDERARADLDHDDVYLEFLKRRYVDALYSAPRFEAYLRSMQAIQASLSKSDDAKAPIGQTKNDSDDTGSKRSGSGSSSVDPRREDGSHDDSRRVDVTVSVAVPRGTLVGGGQGASSVADDRTQLASSATETTTKLPLTPLSQTAAASTILPPLPPR